MSRPSSDYVDVEVVSAGGKLSKQAPVPGTDPLFALIARLMDDLFTIPGTKIRFGLDPLIGLIPGLGDTSGAIVSTLLIFRGAKAGIPRVILVRMASNVLLNTLGGAIPVLGDLFSAWFKSNQLNYALYQKHVGSNSTPSKADWGFVCLLLAILLLAVGFIITLSVMLFAAMAKFSTS